jgi:hypothetical protein
MRQNDVAPVSRDEKLILDHLERIFDSAVDIDKRGISVRRRFYKERNGPGVFLQFFFDLKVFIQKRFRS